MPAFLIQKTVKIVYEITIEADSMVEAQKLAMENGEALEWRSSEPIEIWRADTLEPWEDFPEMASFESMRDEEI